MRRGLGRRMLWSNGGHCHDNAGQGRTRALRCSGASGFFACSGVPVAVNRLPHPPLPSQNIRPHTGISLVMVFVCSPVAPIDAFLLCSDATSSLDFFPLWWYTPAFPAPPPPAAASSLCALARHLACSAGAWVLAVVRLAHVLLDLHRHMPDASPDTARVQAGKPQRQCQRGGPTEERSPFLDVG